MFGQYDDGKECRESFAPSDTQSIAALIVAALVERIPLDRYVYGEIDKNMEIE